MLTEGARLRKALPKRAGPCGLIGGLILAPVSVVAGVYWAGRRTADGRL
ncbi:MAG: hypothetical protein HY748_12365 [Elusimicrobia bacterium]|nr:hypothetical protein [Elusimicrobiota bacterium]